MRLYCDAYRFILHVTIMIAAKGMLSLDVRVTNATNGTLGRDERADPYLIASNIHAAAAAGSEKPAWLAIPASLASLQMVFRDIRK
jgi:hypothetical protein